MVSPTEDSRPPGPNLSGQIGRVAAPLREQVLALIRQAILDFRYLPGQRLIERELVEQTGVSRTTIREVLRELDAEGLVETIPQRGAIVVVPTPEQAAEIYEIRGALEALAARKFVANRTPAQLGQLRDAAERFSRAVTAQAEIVELLKVKDDFYRVLFEGAGNATIGTLLSGLQARVRMLRATSLSQPGRPQQAAEELEGILDAIEAGDGEAAAAACTAHVNRAAATGFRARVTEAA